ncbi:membrane protein insertase YidC [Streptomyces sp. J2-1]|uniref:membrane protein insertase YidC n=1 Tax=Streptomyces corallincola TaxID=2851888 RepID=UPI001C3944F3|nr:membrane protein insertase YidC [Streptomyces corallincola]MBV2354434.1 membrane protein insertase YidC [Streptomyces corallincola]
MSVFARLVEQLADLLQPLCGASATAAAIVLFTALVRLLAHPLARAAARGTRARARLQPRLAELRRKHARDPERLRRAVLELHAEEKVSPFSGLLPGLLQLPVFFLLYHLFTGSSAGAAGGLLSHTLLSAPLAGHWLDALAHGGPFGSAGLVYVALFALVAAVATVNVIRARRTADAAFRTAATSAATTPARPSVSRTSSGSGNDKDLRTGEDAGKAKGRGRGNGTGGSSAVGNGSGEQIPGLAAAGRVAPYLSFLTLATVAVVPLAAALYVVTSTTWTAVERVVLAR